MKYELLCGVNSPCDLKGLTLDRKMKLCAEIREFLVETVSEKGGHLASNLGVVELSVALHNVFDSPKDHIIFDVGHQAYVHKLLTGRRDYFDNLRVPGGLSGFTTRREGEHDPFGAGHSSTAISAALGFAESDRLKGNDVYTVCVVGDGSCTGGMIHEALNNVKKDLKMIIVLNENRMSISKNKGAFASYLAKVRSSKSYIGWKKTTNSALKKLPILGKPLISALSFVKNKLKRLVYSNNYFEELGLYYLGPIDGNDYDAMERILTEAKQIGKSVIIHTYTKKGKGYVPAEISPHSFHSISSTKCDKPHFNKVFANHLCEIAENDGDIVAVTAAMGIGTGLEAFGEKYPERYFDVGIAEGHALTFSAGLAAAGLKPYTAIYSTFLQRGYDSILHDIALQRLPVRMIIDRAGLAVSDGATHHGIFDVSFLSHIPDIDLYSPVTYGSLKTVISDSAKSSGPVAVRYSNDVELEGVAEIFYKDGDYSSIGVKADYSGNTPKYIFVTYGNIVGKVIEAKRILEAQGISCGIILVEKLRPYSESVRKIAELLRGAERVLFVEEGIKNGGYSMIALNKIYSEYPILRETSFDITAIDDNFAIPDSICDLYDFLGLSPERLSERILSIKPRR